MKLGRSYKQHAIEDKFDAIVIGSGIGGLASAALLARFAHKRVLVLERHYAVGGFTHTFTRPGYDWDVGVHYIGQMQPFSLMRRLFDGVSDGSLAWADMGEVYDTIVVGDERYEFVAGRDRFRARMCEYFPKLVISDAGVFNTFGRLVPREASRQHAFDAALAKVEPSIAHASLYLGFRHTAAALKLGKSNL